MPNAAQVQFTPSATVTLKANQIASTVMLPAVDGANTAVVMKNLGPNTLAVVAGDMKASSVFNMAGAIVLMPGQMILTSDPGLSGGTLATIGAQGNAALTFMRGSTADVFLFPAPGVAVF